MSYDTDNEPSGCGCIILIVFVILFIHMCNRINNLEDKIEPQTTSQDEWIIN